MAGWGQIATGAVAGAAKAPAKSAPKKPAPKPKKASNSWGNVAKAASSGATGGAVGGTGGQTWGDVGRAAAVGGAGFASSPDIQAIMRQSGSTDPSDPYNWRGIRAALDAQSMTPQPNPGGGYGGDSASSYTPPAPTPPPVPSVFEAASQAPPIPRVEPPSAVVGSGQGAVGAPTGMTFESLGSGGTFGQFDRMRNQRQPRTGLSVTPEMLRAAARARLGSA